jgi:hypothetical protein
VDTVHALDDDHARERGDGGRDPRRRPRHRTGGLPRHDRARAATDDWPDLRNASWPPTSWCSARRSGSARSRRCARVIERLYGNSSELNPAGQYAYYGKVGGCLVTGNEDGIKHCAMNMLYSLQHLGYTIPPQADAGGIGEAGPGPSYLDPKARAGRRTTSPNGTRRS